jgi:hypothetical protein
MACSICHVLDTTIEKDGAMVCTSCGVVQPGRCVDSSPEHGADRYDDFQEFLQDQRASPPDNRVDVSKLLDTPSTIGPVYRVPGTPGTKFRHNIVTTASRYDHVGTGAQPFQKGLHLLTQQAHALRIPVEALREAEQLWLRYCQSIQQPVTDTPTSTRHYRVEKTEVPAVLLHVVQMHGLPLVVEDLVENPTSEHITAVTTKLTTLRKSLLLPGPSVYMLLKAQVIRALLQQTQQQPRSSEQKDLLIWTIRFLADAAVRVRASHYGNIHTQQWHNKPDPLLKEGRWAVATLCHHIQCCLYQEGTASSYAPSLRMGNDKRSRYNSKRKRDEQTTPFTLQLSSMKPSEWKSSSSSSTRRWRSQPTSQQGTSSTSNVLFQVPNGRLVALTQDPLLLLTPPLQIQSKSEICELVITPAAGDTMETLWARSVGNWKTCLPRYLTPQLSMHNYVRSFFLWRFLQRDDLRTWRKQHTVFAVEHRQIWFQVCSYLSRFFSIEDT